jgi:hypothetical protein
MFRSHIIISARLSEKILLSVVQSKTFSLKQVLLEDTPKESSAIASCFGGRIYFFVSAHMMEQPFKEPHHSLYWK